MFQTITLIINVGGDPPSMTTFEEGHSAAKCSLHRTNQWCLPYATRVRLLMTKVTWSAPPSSHESPSPEEQHKLMHFSSCQRSPISRTSPTEPHSLVRYSSCCEHLPYFQTLATTHLDAAFLLSWPNCQTSPGEICALVKRSSSLGHLSHFTLVTILYYEVFLVPWPTYDTLPGEPHTMMKCSSSPHNPPAPLHLRNTTP